ncbi:MAG: hypothetical protein MUR46_02930, partial [Loktanella sp.]|nr:hypothetical protein [Loktanella sp.]
MIKPHLKSGTALLVSLSLVAPFPAFAQSAFPCVAPSGDEVSDAAGFAANVLASGNTDLTAGTCTQDALDQALALSAAPVEEV